jgi:hypothetical protein
MVIDAEQLAASIGLGTAKRMRHRLAQRRAMPYKPGCVGTVTARIDGGRLVADCPYCKGAEVVSRTDREFFCFSCGMVGNDSHPMAVVLPEGA